MRSVSTSLRRILLSPSFSEFSSDDGLEDVMDEDTISNLSLRVKVNLTVWDFILPTTPSLPAVIGVSFALPLEGSVLSFYYIDEGRCYLFQDYS